MKYINMLISKFALKNNCDILILKFAFNFLNNLYITKIIKISH